MRFVGSKQDTPSRLVIGQGEFQLRKLLALSVLTVSVAATSTAQAESLRIKHKPFSQMSRAQVIDLLKRQIHKDKSVIRFWKNHRELASLHRTTAQRQVRWATISLRVASKNLRKLTRVARRGISGSDIHIWMCIHSYEGAWNDPNAPYWGGLQMDLTFQQTYGGNFMKRWGTADHWPIWAQIAAARRARDSGRGYSPWPNTARYCGVA